MTKTFTNSVLRFVFLAGALAIPAMAPAGQSPGELAFASADLDRSNSLHGSEFATLLREGLSVRAVHRQFTRADRNKDQKITLKEYLVFIGERKPPTKAEDYFDLIDEDESGEVSLQELISFSPGNTSSVSHQRTFLIADADESFLLSLEEWLRYKKGIAEPPPGVSLLDFDLADTTQDDRLEVWEFGSALPNDIPDAKLRAKFAKLDKNGDEVLTRNEWNPGAPKNPPL